LFNNALCIVCFPFWTACISETPLSITIMPWSSYVACICGSYSSCMRYTASGGSSLYFSVTIASWHCVMQYYEPNLTVFNKTHTATLSNRNRGILRPIGWCSNFVWNIGNFSPWSSILMPTFQYVWYPQIQWVFHWWRQLVSLH
jgi:hypothetical protein